MTSRQRCARGWTRRSDADVPPPLILSPPSRGWSRNAQPSPDPARDQPRSLHLCDAAFRQSRARQYFARSDGRGPRHPEGDLAVAPRGGDSLSVAFHPHEPRLLGALCPASFPLDPARGDAARPRPFNSLPPRRSFRRHPRRAQSIRTGEELRAGIPEILGQLAFFRRAAGDPSADRLDSRLPRAAFLAAAEAFLSARERASSRRCGAPADACSARLLPGRRADNSSGSEP